MDSKIQQLTETIYNEGVQKARKESEAIIKEAKEKAAEIEKAANKKAESLITKANVKAEELKNQIDSEIKMTLNQAITAIKQEITSLVTLRVIQPSIKELFSDKDFLKNLISTMVKGWMEKESMDVNIILPEKNRELLEEYFENSLANELNNGLKVSFSKDVKSGFKIGPVNASYVISFTDEDFINFLKAYLRPKTSKMLFEEEK